MNQTTVIPAVLPALGRNSAGSSIRALKQIIELLEILACDTTLCPSTCDMLDASIDDAKHMLRLVETPISEV